jgi:hypothetical protein
MPQVGYEPTIQLFEQAKTVYALDLAVTVLGHQMQHKSHIGNNWNAYKGLVGLLERDHLENLGADGALLLKLILK